MENQVGCIHGLIKELCKEKGLDYKYEQYYSSLKKAIKENRSYNIKVVKNGIEYPYPQRRQIKGGGFVFDCEGKIFTEDTEWEFIKSKRTRTTKDIDLPKPSGKYKDSQGGGWYSMVDKYNYKGKEYAAMDCNCF